MARPLDWILTLRARRRIAAGWRRLTRRPPVGRVDFGDLRRLRPISDDWGFDRGTPVDRHYIDVFLGRNADAVRGRVLEIGSDDLTRAWGGDRVTQSDVLHVAEASPPITIVSDLITGDGIADGSFDCVIMTQTLDKIYDAAAAVRTVYRILRPGGVALVTFPGITRISRYDMDRWGHYWSFTTRSARRLFEQAFAADDVQVEAFGNVLAAIAFLHGVAATELRPTELEHTDPDYELLVAVRARRPDA